MKHIKPINRINSRGDTIVEVLIVLAVLSLAFAISYATANRGLSQSRNAEEHSQALGVMNSQVELVRTAVSKRVQAVVSPTGAFCIAGSDVTNPANIVPLTDPNNLSTYPAGCKQNDLYYQSVQKSDGNYVFTTTWDGVGSLGVQKEQVTYRINELQNTSFTGIQLNSSPPQVRVIVKKISPNADNTSSQALCNGNNARVNRSGTTATLRRGLEIHSGTTDSSSSYTFTLPGAEGNTYTTTIVPPTNFEACPPTAKPVQATAGQVTTVEMEIYPLCYRVITGWSPVYGPSYVDHSRDYTTGGDPIYSSFEWYPWRQGARTSQWDGLYRGVYGERHEHYTDGYTPYRGYGLYMIRYQQGKEGDSYWTWQSVLTTYWYVSGWTPVVVQHDRDVTVTPIIGYTPIYRNECYN